ncbi:MAG: hypothetical protein ABEJ66_01460 [Candidatus Nanohaloarchaea archaeon]
MSERDFYIRLGGTLLLALSASSVLTTTAGMKGLLAGAFTLSALVLLRSAETSSRKEGRDDRMKVALVSTTVLYELVLLVGAASLAGKFVSVLAVAAVSFSELLHVETQQRLKQSFTPDIGREGRVSILAFAFAGYSFNSWILFYGLAFIALLAIYDSLALLHRLRTGL